ncbi:MAG: anti-sigma factor [Gemmatimonadales bacterium]
MSHPEQGLVSDLAAAYALGALGPEEQREFEALLSSSPEARREVDEYREVAALLALTIPVSAAPRADLRARVLGGLTSRRVGGAVPTRGVRRPRPMLLWGALAASLLAVVGLGANMLSLRGRVAALETDLTASQRSLAERGRELAERLATLNAILEPGVRLYQLTASGDPDPGIQLFWDQQRNLAIVHGFRLKPVPTGRAYQLWFIKDGKPVPSITFKPESSGHVRIERIPVPADGSLGAAAVTVEPESGSTQPTSPIILMGPLEKS